jgi:hypothetical protein
METENKNLEDHEFWRRQAFLKYTTESSEVDYKTGVKLESKSAFAYKLVKHILGMANSGGGYLVIGYKEDGKTKVPTAENITDDIIQSYDVSSLAEIVESFTSGEDKIELKIHKEKNPENNLIYPIVEVFGFTKRPFFCAKDATSPLSDPKKPEQILRRGALYVRTASARTGILATPDQWDLLIDKCVESSQDELMKRFKNMMKSVGFSSLEDQQKKSTRNEEISALSLPVIEDDFKKKAVSVAGLEISHSLVDLDKKWTKKELIDAMEASQQKNTGWPIGTMYRYNKDGMPTPLANGIVLKIESSFDGTYDYWKILEDGTFYFFRNFQEDLTKEGKTKKILWFDTRVWRVIEGIKHMISLYKNLGVYPTQIVSIEIKHYGIDERELTASEGLRSFVMFPRKSGKSKNVTWRKEATLDEFFVNSEEYTVEAMKDMLSMFEFWEPANGVIEGVIQDYNASAIRH